MPSARTSCQGVMAGCLTPQCLVKPTSASWWLTWIPNTIIASMSFWQAAILAVLLSQPQAKLQRMPAATRKELLHAVMHSESVLPLHWRLLGKHMCFLRCEESAPGACSEGAYHS